MEPVEVMAEYAAAWERGDAEAAWQFYADDVVMNLPGRGSLAGAHVGRANVIAAIQALLARTSDKGDSGSPWRRWSRSRRPIVQL
jgi:ketosteroid isomerase-like protein